MWIYVKHRENIGVNGWVRIVHMGET